MTRSQKFSLALALLGSAWAMERGGAWVPAWVVVACVGVGWFLIAVIDWTEAVEKID